MKSRRDFLRFLAASPVLAGCPAVLQALSQAASLNDVIGSPADALSVLDFEAAARKVLPPAHWGYMTTGVDDDATLRANREGFAHYQIRPRRLVDVRKVDTTTELFGSTWATPIVLAPVGGHKMFHPEGDRLARAAKAKGRPPDSLDRDDSSVEDVIAAGGGPIIRTTVSDIELGRAPEGREARGGRRLPGAVLTVDLSAAETETADRSKKLNTRRC